MTRTRIWQTSWIVAVLALGLLSRSRAVAWPWWVTAYVGDALWAWLVFLGFGWLWTRWSTWRVACCALAFSFVIEFSQLIHTPWLDALRANRFAALVLGQGFLWSDLVCYSVGIAIGAMVERFTSAD
jgi:Protein of unknown function (DUF2809)